MGGKTIPLAKIFDFQLNVTVAILFIPLIFSINDIINEVYGKDRARSVVQSALVMVFLVFVCSMLFAALPPSMRFAPKEAAYDTIFGLSARIAAASLIAFAVAEFLDIYIFAKIREKLGKKSLWLRTNVSNFASQLVDSVIFISLAFYGLNQSFDQNLPFLISLIVPYWLLKCAMSVLETPLVYLGVKWLKSDKSSNK